MNGMRVLRLSREGGSGPRAYHLALPERGAPGPQSHEGHEWLYVVDGQVRLVLGDEDLLLAAETISPDLTRHADRRFAG